MLLETETIKLNKQCAFIVPMIYSINKNTRQDKQKIKQQKLNKNCDQN